MGNVVKGGRASVLQSRKDGGGREEGSDAPE